MADYETIMKALRNADAAGDTEAAKRLAKMAQQARTSMQEQPEQPKERTLRQRLYDNFIGDPNDGVDSFGERAGRTLDDMGAAAGAGLVRGASGIADLPGAAFGAGADAGAWVAEKLGLASPEQAAQSAAAVRSMESPRMGNGQTVRETASDLTGGATEFRGDTTAGRYAGTAAEFIPGSLQGGGSMMRNALAYGVIPGLASEGAGQLTEGTAAEPWARMAAPIVAGGLAGGVTRPKGPQAPTSEALRQQADDLYAAGASRPAASSSAVQSLRGQIDQTLQDLNVKTPAGRVVADGNVKKFIDVLDDFDGQQMTPQQMQTARRMLTDAAGSADAADRRIGAVLLEKFDDWRNTAVPEYAEADKLYGRMKRAKDVDFRVEKAERRAASSGTGGNSVNTARQNIRQILDNPKARRGYSAEEIAAMEGIVRGTASTNALRLAGRLSPTSGALPLMGNIAGVGVNPMLAIPMMGAAAGAKGLSEVLTNRQINALSAMIRNGAPLPGNALAGLDDAALAVLAGRSAMNAEQ